MTPRDAYEPERLDVWKASIVRLLIDANTLIKNHDYDNEPRLFPLSADAMPSRLECWYAINWIVCLKNSHYRELREWQCAMAGINPDALRDLCIKDYRLNGNLDESIRLLEGA